MGGTGGDTLVKSLVRGGVDVCFANPGTSEMHFTGALDREPRMRCILGLFEGVVSGAADGYYRIARRPAATLLHLGPGLGNALANLHNAGKGRAGIVNIVGEHATYHRGLESPLRSRLEDIAASISDHVLLPHSPDDLARDAARAVAFASSTPGQIATLILPADLSWLPGAALADTLPLSPVPLPDAAAILAAAEALSRGPSAMLFLGGDAVRGRSLELAGRIAAHTGCRLLSEGYNQRHERGAGRVRVDRLPTTPVSAAVARLADVETLVLAGSADPIAFFAYPDMPSRIAPDGCKVLELVPVGNPTEQALEMLCEALGAMATPPAPVMSRTAVAPVGGALTPETIGEVLAALLPEQAIVVDESVTTGRGFAAPTATAAPHDWLSIMGGSIGFALPCAIGAAVAAPDRQVIALEGDGSGMYTPQSLWTMAREGLKIAIIVFANRRYAILENEFRNTGSGVPGPRARAMLEIGAPDIDWVKLASAQGVEAGRADDVASFASELARAIDCAGPYLIQVDL
ncbi:acetolactate synthase large subunit [Sphingomonas sp. 35-24ZXX]|uniref:acetolactate synthase large subunit n=1 Tax=Sphingomonas sp. 35-24ZXX TaxID=1545915 RepID=UPI00053BF36F|nr:acetolactate synthase large subunit [Sphingomonas sp. 35-24ZXX]